MVRWVCYWARMVKLEHGSQREDLAEYLEEKVLAGIVEAPDRQAAERAAAVERASRQFSRPRGRNSPRWQMKIVSELSDKINQEERLALQRRLAGEALRNGLPSGSVNRGNRRDRGIESAAALVAHNGHAAPRTPEQGSEDSLDRDSYSSGPSLWEICVSAL